MYRLARMGRHESGPPRSAGAALSRSIRSRLATDRGWTLSCLECSRSALRERCRTPPVRDLLLDSHGCGRVDKNVSPVGAAARGGVVVDSSPGSPAITVCAALQLPGRSNREWKLDILLPRLGLVVKAAMACRAATLHLHAYVAEGRRRISSARKYLHPFLGDSLTV